MKKTSVLAVALLLTLMCCSTEESMELGMEEKGVFQKNEQINTNETPLASKVVATFSKMVQDKLVLSNLETVIQDDIAMLTNDDNVMVNTVFEDNVMLLSFLTIRDDLIMGKTTFEDLFIATYEGLYSEEITYEVIFKSLPKLYLALPVMAFEEYDIWKEKGYPVAIKSYNIVNNKLKKITEEEVQSIIGQQNYTVLIKEAALNNESYYFFSEDDQITVIASNENNGAVIVIGKEETSVASFKIEDQGSYNTIEVVEKEESILIKQSNMMSQTYVDFDLPMLCNSYYSFECNSLQLINYLNEEQQRADESCETFETCISVCCDGTIKDVIYLFKPKANKCKLSDTYINQLSMYSLVK